MREETYLIFRKIAFWMMFFIFVFLTPLVVFYSVGYKFDRSTNKFLKTGLISIKTFPKGVKVVLNEKIIQEATPCVLRDLFPRQYNIVLEKEGFYPYQALVDVRPSLVSELDVVLVPKERNIEKLKFDFNIYRFFINRQFFGEKIIIFSDQGVYILDQDFKNIQKISNMDLGAGLVNTLEGLKQYGNRLIFWNKNNIWMIMVEEATPEAVAEIVPLYSTQEDIKDVFLGLKERYLVIHAGLKIIALDIQNPSVSFPLFQAKSPKAEIFYDARSETVFIKDVVLSTDRYSLFKVELVPILNEKKEHEKTS